MRLLIIESEVSLATFLQQAFAVENYQVEVCGVKSAAVAFALECDCDAIIVDLLLPDDSEMVLLKQIRIVKPAIIIVVLSSSDRVEDRVAALEAGADELMGKPFSVAELSVRLRGLLRRRESNSILQLGDLQLDLVQRTVCRSGRKIGLTAREFSLLEFLMRHAGCCVSRELILEHVWGVAGSVKTNIVDVYVAYVRSKLGGSALPPLIHTVRGMGYEISCQPPTQASIHEPPSLRPSREAVN